MVGEERANQEAFPGVSLGGRDDGLCKMQQQARGGVGIPKACLSSESGTSHSKGRHHLHFPANRSSFRFVRMYLKNSYTDQAIAVEGIW